MVEGVNSSLIHLIYLKNFCKCHNVPQHNNTNIKKKKKKTIESVLSSPRQEKEHSPRSYPKEDPSSFFHLDSLPKHLHGEGVTVPGIQLGPE
jgi:hypothetical protein